MGKFRNLFSKKEIRIRMVGLDAAGKTTILYKLKLGEIVTTTPTIGKHGIQAVNIVDLYHVCLYIGFNVESVKYRKISFIVWDVGGQEKFRPFWRQYLSDTQGIFLVL